jgi:hypothetical protein
MMRGKGLFTVRQRFIGQQIIAQLDQAESLGKERVPEGNRV